MQTATTSTTSLSNTLAAIYATEHDARDAIKELHKAGFKQTWLGFTRPPDADTGTPMVEDPGGLARFISSVGDRLPLHKALVMHGLSQDQAQQIEQNIAPGCSIVTAYGEDNPDRARQLLEVHKGHVVGATFDQPTAVAIGSTSPRTGVDKDEKKAADEDRKLDDRHDDVDRSGNLASSSDHVMFGDYAGETFYERPSRP